MPLAKALKRGGIGVIEVVLRTPVSLQAIQAIKEQVPEVIVGAGTVLNEEQLVAAIDSGAEFIVTPGLTPELLRAGLDASVPMIPGVATASEVMVGLQAGLSTFKFSRKRLVVLPQCRPLSAPFADVSFCPTGGISPSNMHSYLHIESVVCVGGSWITPHALMRTRDWNAITELASAAVALASDVDLAANA